MRKQLLKAAVVTMIGVLCFAGCGNKAKNSTITTDGST